MQYGATLLPWTHPPTVDLPSVDLAFTGSVVGAHGAADMTSSLGRSDDDSMVSMIVTSSTPFDDSYGTAADGGRAAAASAACEPLMKFVINTLFAGALCIIGFAGNTASYVVLGRDTDMLPVARFLLRSLALADNAFLVVWFVDFSLWDLVVYTGLLEGSSSATSDHRSSSSTDSSGDTRRTTWMFIRMATYPILFIIQTATIWLTVLIAGSRCLIVCRPAAAAVYCSLKATRIGVASVAILSVLYNVPRYFETTVVWNSSGVATLSRTELGSSPLYQLVYFDVLHYIISFFLPLLLLTFFNARLIVVYRAFRRKRQALRAVNPGRRAHRLPCGESSEQSVTLIMIVVILVFIVCNVPAKGVQIFWKYRHQYCPTVAFFVHELSVVFELIASSVNFLVYCVFLRRFRQRFSHSCIAGVGGEHGTGASGIGCGQGRDGPTATGTRLLNVRRATGDGLFDNGPASSSAAPAVIYRRSLDF